MDIGHLCTRRVVTVPAEASLSEVVALMSNERTGAIMVTRAPADRPIVVGIITDRDVLHAQLSSAADFTALSVAEAMTSDPLLLRIDEDIAEALRRMRARGVRRAPVVDAHGGAVGFISIDDLLIRLARDLSGLAAIAAGQAGRAR